MPGELITANCQIQWGDLLLGDGTSFRWRTVTGWEDLPGQDSANVARSARHGSWPGRSWAMERVVGFQGAMRPGSRAEYVAMKRAVRAATSVAETDVEAPLVIRTHDETLLAYAKPSLRIMPADEVYGAGVLVPFTIGWTCSDPRRYDLTPASLTVPAPAPGTGLVFPLTFPLSFGTVGSPGTGTATNTGGAPAHPVLTITGPVVAPLVVNTATGTVLEFDLTLVAGESLVVDTDAGTVLLGGGNRLASLTALSVPVEAFVLAAGDNPLALRALSFPAPGASLGVTWRSASW